MIDTAVAVVTVGSSRRMQTKHHLVPVLIFAQVLWVPCDAAFRQRLELSHQFLPLVHGVETMHPKNNLHLDFQGEHIAKRFVLGIHQPSAVHLDTVTIRQLASPLGPSLLILSYRPIPISHQDLGVHDQRCTHGGHPLESPLVIYIPT